MYIIYGSETGNAAELAETLGDRVRRLRIDCRVVPFGHLSLAQLQNETHIFVICSTTGQGALPRNTLPLWTQLRKSSLPADTLASVRFGAFGLGDNAYKQFNWAIRKIHTRFVQLGAVPFVQRSEGDEQNPDGVEIVFDQWMESALAALSKELDISDPVPTTTLLEPQFLIKTTGTPLLPPTAALEKATLIKNDRLTAADHFQDVRHLSLDLGRSLEYQPGAIMYLYPCNSDNHVDAVIEAQKWQDIADTPVEVDEKWIELLPRPLHNPLTLRTLLKWHLDLNGIPRRTFFRTAAHFAEGNEAERLAEFASTEGIQDLYNYANRPRRSLVETILEFETLKIPFEYILDMFPLCYPRAFSIASEANSSVVELCIAIVKYRTVLRRIRRGLCSRFIEGLQVGQQVEISLEPAPTPLATALSPDQALILVAAGTGIAPIRSLLHTIEGHQAPVFLFFGCRFETKDFLYADEWQELTKTTNLKIITAFSREGGGYVQNKVEAAAEQITAYLPTALIYLCGSSGKMPQAVRDAFVDVLKRTRHLDEDTARKVIAYKERHHTFVEETW